MSKRSIRPKELTNLCDIVHQLVYWQSRIPRGEAKNPEFLLRILPVRPNMLSHELRMGEVVIVREHDEPASRSSDPRVLRCSQSRPLHSDVPRVQTVGVRAPDSFRVICRAVIDDDDLEIGPIRGLTRETLQNAVEQPSSIVRRNHDTRFDLFNSWQDRHL